MSAFDRLLEPAAIAAGQSPNASALDAAALSIAISAKRIADALDEIRADIGAGPDRMGLIGRVLAALPEALGDAIPAAGLEQAAFRMGQAFERGRGAA